MLNYLQPSETYPMKIEWEVINRALVHDVMNRMGQKLSAMSSVIQVANMSDSEWAYCYLLFVLFYFWDLPCFTSSAEKNLPKWLLNSETAALNDTHTFLTQVLSQPHRGLVREPSNHGSIFTIGDMPVPHVDWVNAFRYDCTLFNHSLSWTWCVDPINSLIDNHKYIFYMV